MTKFVNNVGELINRGAADQEFQMLYHTNFGTPLLKEGATFVAAIERITPLNAHANAPRRLPDG